MSMEFTVEVITAPPTDGWACLREVLDVIPGSLLIEDPEQPMLIVPVTATDWREAAKFVHGVLTLKGIQDVSGRVTPAPEDDFDLGPEDDDAAELDLTHDGRWTLV